MKLIDLISLIKYDNLIKNYINTKIANHITPGDTSLNELLEIIYPIGSIYISTNNINPRLLFNIGEWEAIEDRFLLGAGTHIAGEVGGEETHILTEEELAPHHHHHTPNMLTASVDTVNGFTVGQATNKEYTKIASIADSEVAGGGQAHNNMPPYLVVYMWKRIS